MKEKDIKKRVYHHFQSGFHCAEVVLKTTMEIYSDKSDSGFIRMASGFGGGIAGTTEDLCGAFTGGVLAIGYFFGRDNPGEVLSQGGTMIKELKQKFMDEFNHLKCAALTESFGDDGQMGCVRVTAETTVMVAKMVEMYEFETKSQVETIFSEPREKVELGICPFGCSC
jgi:C_GCAxxG_C_C family probable redox protein